MAKCGRICRNSFNINDRSSSPVDRQAHNLEVMYGSPPETDQPLAENS